MHPFSRTIPRLPIVRLLLAWLAVALCEGAQGEEAARSWRLADAPLRAVYRNIAPAVSTVELPAKTKDGTSLQAVAAYAGTNRLPAKVVSRTPEGLVAVVDGRQAGTGGEIALYGLPAPLPDGPAFDEEGPVHFRVTLTGVFEAPPTAADMIAMADGHPRDAVFEFDIPAVGYLKSAAAGEARGWHRSNWRNFTYLAEYSGLLRIPEKGSYRFAVSKRATGPVYLLVGDELVVEAPNKGMRPIADRPKSHKSKAGKKRPQVPDPAPDEPVEWLPGKTLELEKGLVPYRVLTFCKRFCEVTVGWVPPSAGEGAAPTEIPDDAWAAARPPRAVRLEHRDAQEPFSTAIDLRPRPRDSYAFDGCDAIFLPVGLRSLHPLDEAGGATTCRWSRDDKGAIAEGAETNVVVAKRGGAGPAPVIRLVCRNGNETARAKTEVPFPARAAIRHRLSAELTGVAPFAYGADRVRPGLEIRTTLPDGVPLVARATYRPVAGGTDPEVFEETIRPVRNWCRALLPVRRAGELAAIDWEILHAGIVVTKGRTLFEQAPFRHGPDGARGNDLLLGRDQIVLVPRRLRNETSPARPRLPSGGTIAILDGFASPAGGFDTKALESFAEGLATTGSVETIRLADLGGDGRYHGGLGFAARLGSIGRPDLLVIAPDFKATADGAPLALFERHLAALASIARDVLGLEVMVMTPPPGLLAAADLERPPEMRDYAEAVLRVADAHAIPVADLYTLCRTRSVRAIAPDGTFTAEGARLAGEAIANRIDR